MEVLGNTASGMDNRGGVSRTRSFDYSLFASELFDRVTVLKSYAAIRMKRCRRHCATEYRQAV